MSLSSHRTTRTSNTSRNPKTTIVIGAGIGGLTTAALLCREGHRVTVLEAQVYPGGCAGTFPYKGYRFDAGATLAGGFSPGGPHAQVADLLGLTWPIQPVEPAAWVVHLPDGRQVTQWTDPQRWQDERRDAFPCSEPFWRTQERLADIAWDISSRPFPWPPTSWREFLALVRAVRPKTLLATPHLLRKMAALMPPDVDPMLGAFVDANLLISAQTTAAQANALYASAALELPRRGVNQVHRGIGGLAETLVRWLRDNGGQVLYRQNVVRIERRKGGGFVVKTNAPAPSRQTKGDRLELSCDNLVCNLTPWALARLLGDQAPTGLRRELRLQAPTWGAFMLYLGLDASQLPPDIADHHQVILDHTKPLGETNSIFISMSDPADPTRAPDGMRAVNISTHTEIGQWWALRDDPDKEAAYHDKRDAYTAQMIAAADRVIPGFQQAIALTLPATPVTYEHWTNRPQGMVGGFPQTSLFTARPPTTGIDGLWLVGDSIFPGQSTAGTTLGAMRVARAIVGAPQGLTP